MGNSCWAKSLSAGGQCEKWAGGEQQEKEEEKEEEEEEEVSTWAATTCSSVARRALPPGANSRIPKPRPAPPLHSTTLCCIVGMHTSTSTQTHTHKHKHTNTGINIACHSAALCALRKLHKSNIGTDDSSSMRYKDRALGQLT